MVPALERLPTTAFSGLRRLVPLLVPSMVFRKAQDVFVYQHRIRSLGINGGEVPLPEGFFFEVRTRCSGTCSFCAAAVQTDTREDMSMEFDLYAKVIDELKGLNYSGKIAYHVNNEPLIFRDLVKFVQYAREMLPDAWIQILSNGNSLKRAEALVTAGINELSINHYTADTSAPLPARLTEFKEKVLLKYMKPEQIGTGHRPATGNDGVFRFNIALRQVDAVLTNRAGTAPNKVKADTAKGRVRGFCEYPFTQFNIRADGTVSMCCADLYFSIPMGNVKHQSVMEIWRGNKFGQVRETLLKGRRVFETCKNCDFYGVRKTALPGAFLSRLVYRFTE